MGFFRQMRGLSRNWALEGVTLYCPSCGNTGTDGQELSADVDSETVAAFGVRGQDRGKPVRECLHCHEWWFAGRRHQLIAIPHKRQALMKAYYADQTTAFEARFAALNDNEPPTFDDDGPETQYLPIAESIVCARCGAAGPPEEPLFEWGASVGELWLRRCVTCKSWLFVGGDSPATVLVPDEQAAMLDAIRRGTTAG